MKLLLDENISPTVARALREEDHVDAVHLSERSMLGATDSEVFERAFAESRVIVTINVDDFVRLASTSELHAGLILMEDGSMLRSEQLAAVRAALRQLEGQDMANRALRVLADGSHTLEDIPPAGTG